MDRRQQRGHLLAQDPRIKHVEGAMWFVPSERAGGYLVNVETATCSCPDHTGRGARCKHLVAVELVRGAAVKADAARSRHPCRTSQRQPGHVEAI